MDKFTVKMTITSDDIDNIVDSALYSGISYWCSLGEVGRHIKGVEFMSHEISKGGTLKLTDGEDGKVYLLTKAKLLKGVSLYHNHDYENYDAGDADCIIQLAIFGEVIYG